jgi:hypothetical protein
MAEAEEKPPTHQAFQLPPLRKLVIDFQAGVLILEAETGATLTFALGKSLTITTSQSETPQAETAQAPAEAGTKGKQQTVQLSGKLKSKPKPDRPDSQGKPTVWAKFAAHIEGESEAHMFSTTFHRASAEQALTFEREDRITVQGYIRPSQEPGRMDALSVFAIQSPKA